MKYFVVSFMIFATGLSLLGLSIGVLFGHIALETEHLLFSQLNLQSLMIILGALMINLVIASPASLIMQSVSVFFNAVFRSKHHNSVINNDIDNILEWQKGFRTSKIKALRSFELEYEDKFEGYLFSLSSTNYDPSTLQAIAEKKIYATYNLRLNAASVFQMLGSASPAFGMMGTLLGLTILMRSFDDVSALGSGLAFALMTTLYGLLLAQFVFYPIAQKIRMFAEQSADRQFILLEGFMMMLEDKPELQIKDQLESQIV